MKLNHMFILHSRIMNSQQTHKTFGWTAHSTALNKSDGLDINMPARANGLCHTQYVRPQSVCVYVCVGGGGRASACVSEVISNGHTRQMTQITKLYKFMVTH